MVLALRYLGLGAPEQVAVDEQGRLDPDDLAAGSTAAAGPAIVCLQAGNIHSGAFDPMGRGGRGRPPRRGLGARRRRLRALGRASSPALAALTEGLAGADSWATDAHKTLNTPYDGGIAIVADADAVHRAMGVRASYLCRRRRSTRSSWCRRCPAGRGACRSGRRSPRWAPTACGTSSRGWSTPPAGSPTGIGAIPGAVVLNDVVYTQVSVAFESDERTREVFDRLVAEGTVMPSASVWHGRTVIRFSVSSWRTGDLEVRDTVAAVARAARVPAGVRRPQWGSDRHARCHQGIPRPARRATRGCPRGSTTSAPTGRC